MSEFPRTLHFELRHHNTAFLWGPRQVGKTTLLRQQFAAAREYYPILEDTLLGHPLKPWRKKKRRRLIETAKFYLFHVGVVRALSGMRLIGEGAEEFGRAFEHFLIEEIRAWLAYEEKFLPLAYWRTSKGLEVDLVIGDLDLAVEFKASRKVDERDLKGLRALMDDQRVRQAAVVSQDPVMRSLPGGVTVYPWQQFCQKLWAGDLLA